MSRVWSALMALHLLVVLALPAAALPDLVPEVYDVSVGTGDVDPGDVAEGCAGGPTGRRLLRYSLRARNLGPTDLVLGDPGCPDCQANPGAACSNPLYVCSPAHGHAHFEGFAVGELLDNAGTVVAQSRKYGFCLLDYECPIPRYDCSNQGISAGCADLYDSGLPCQYIDITDLDLPADTYTLRVSLDPQGLLPEANENNNSVSVPVVVADASGTCPATVATSVPAPISDNIVTYATLPVTSSGEITRLTLSNLRLRHEEVGELEIHLISPLGTDVLLFDGSTCSATGLELSFDNASKTAIPCPPNSTQAVRPQQSLSRFAGEPAAGLWTLKIIDTSAANAGLLENWQLDICTKPSCQTALMLQSTDVPKTIPDEADATSEITVPVGSGSVGRVELLGVRGNHSYFRDLEAHLIAPSGRDVTILERSCGPEDLFDFGLTDFAPTQLPCPPTDGLPHLPSNGLTAFIGEPADGPWRLTLYDRAPQDSGTLEAWGLRLCLLGDAPACPLAPRNGCRVAESSSLFMRTSDVAGRRRLAWTWSRGLATLAELGDPTTDTNYALCVYSDSSLVASYPILAGGTCQGGRPCWQKVRGLGYAYRQAGGNSVGLSRIRLRSGTDMARIQVRGSGGQLNLPLPLRSNLAVTVQLQRSGSPECWQSRFPLPALVSGLRYRDRTP